MFVKNTVESILTACDGTILDSHTLLRPQADEIFAILATDTVE